MKIVVDQQVSEWRRFTLEVPEGMTPLEYAEKMKKEDPGYQDYDSLTIEFIPLRDTDALMRTKVFAEDDLITPMLNYSNE